MDRFKLEEQILSIGVMSNHLREIVSGILEDKLDTDKTANGIEGVAVLLDLLEDNLFDTMKYIFKLDEYKNKNESVI